MSQTLAEVIVQCVEAGIDRFITFGSVEDSSIDIIAFELARSLEILKASEPAQTIDDTPR